MKKLYLYTRALFYFHRTSSATYPHKAVTEKKKGLVDISSNLATRRSKGGPTIFFARTCCLPYARVCVSLPSTEIFMYILFFDQTNEDDPIATVCMIFIDFRTVAIFFSLSLPL